MVDLRNAKEALENYLDGYERENDKVKLKIIHTYGVVECSRKIAEEGFVKKSVYLAERINF